MRNKCFSLQAAKLLVVLFCIIAIGAPLRASAQTSLSFASPVTYNTGGGPAVSVAVGDVNGDGIPDIVVANQCPFYLCYGSVGVLLGKGDGTFQTAVTYPTGGVTATSVAIADVNGDGKLDIVATNQYNTYIYVSCGLDECPEISGTGLVSVLLGDGDGTFQAAQTFAPGASYPTSVAVADVNGDGKPDLLVTDCPASSCTFSSAVDGVVSVLLGNGDGTFQTAVPYDSGGTLTESVAVADVNGDGKPDLLVANECAAGGYPCSGLVGVLLGNGNGTFRTVATYASGAIGDFAISLAVADVNGDGKPDVVVADGEGDDEGSYVGPNVIAVLLGNGDGTFQPAITYLTGGVSATSVAIADVNGDGKLDLVVADGGTIYTGSGVVSVLLGNGDGTFQASVNYISGVVIATSVAVADVNKDGKPDLVLADAGSGQANGVVGVFINNGLGVAGTTTTLTSSVNPSMFGQTVTLTATVKPVSSVNSPTGTVTFYLAGSNMGTSTLASNGVATLATGGLQEGGNGITASYGGDSNFGLSASPVLYQTVIGPTAVPVPSTLSFANQKLEISSTPQTVQLSNTGTVGLAISSIQFSGANAGDFTQNNNCGTVLSSGSSCQINVIFAPTNYGTRSATMTITDNAPGNPQSVALTATANPPGVHFVGVGSSAMFDGFAVAAYNDLILDENLPAPAPAGDCPIGDTCVGRHWSIQVGSESGSAYCQDSRTNQDGNLWVVWMEDVTTGLAVDTWAYLSVDSTVGLRCFLARPQAGLVLTGSEGNAGANLVPSNLFADGTGDSFLDDAILSALPSGIPFTAGLTDIRPEDALYATYRVLGDCPSRGCGNPADSPFPANPCPSSDVGVPGAPVICTADFSSPYFYSFSLGYGAFPGPGTAIQESTINGALTGKALSTPVGFALPGFNDPFTEEAVPTTIQTFPVGADNAFEFNEVRRFGATEGNHTQNESLLWEKPPYISQESNVQMWSVLSKTPRRARRISSAMSSSVSAT